MDGYIESFPSIRAETFLSSSFSPKSHPNVHSSSSTPGRPTPRSSHPNLFKRMASAFGWQKNKVDYDVYACWMCGMEHRNPAAYLWHIKACALERGERR